MTTKKLFLTVALFLGLAVVGCQKEQSELSLSNIDGRATITGQVCYNQGYYVDGENIYTEYLAPLANKTVYVDVNLSNYNSSGTHRFSATTNSKGFYSISLPCTDDMGSISATLEVVAFEASYYNNENGVVVNYKSAVYEDNATKAVTAKYGETIVADLDLTATPKYMTDSDPLTRAVVIKGSGLEVYYESATTSTITREQQAFTGTLGVSLTYSSDSSRDLYYEVAVKSGEFDSTVNVYDSWDYYDHTGYLTIKLTSVDGVAENKKYYSDSFTHYYFSTSQTMYTQTLSGYYSNTITLSYTTSATSEVGYYVTTNPSVLSFVPGDKTSVYGITGGITDGYAINNPMGW